MIKTGRKMVQTMVVMGLLVLVISLVTVAPSSAISLAGQYHVTSGDLLGSTFYVAPGEYRQS
jgi:hypothetical protein